MCITRELTQQRAKETVTSFTKYLLLEKLPGKVSMEERKSGQLVDLFDLNNTHFVRFGLLLGGVEE